MTLSIEVLPAPFGPMMARISPPEMAKDPSGNALTPPNDNETLSTERSAPPPPGGGRSARSSGPGGGDSASAPSLPSPSRGGWPYAITSPTRGEGEEDG